MVVPFCFQTKIGLGAGIKMLRLVVVVSVVESHIHVSGPMVLLSIYPTLIPKFRVYFHRGWPDFSREL